MKKALFSALFIFSFFGMFSQATIKLKIKKSKTKKVWIYNQSKSISDTIKLNFFNKATYWITDEFAERLLYIKPLESDFPFVVHINSEESVKAKTKLPDLHQNLSILGSPESKSANEFLYKMEGYKTAVKKAEEKLYKDETADGQYYYDSIIQSVTADSKDYLKDRISKESNTSILLLASSFIDYEQDYKELLVLESKLKDNYSHSESYKKIKKSIFKYEMSQKRVNRIGEESPVLILPGVNGEDVSTDVHSGNYILIDFWASWCKPCRAEHPRLTRLYSEYHDSGLEIYSISLDRDKAKWIKAIKKDQLNWPDHVSNLSMFNSPAVKIFNVNSLPSNVLVDREGKVVAFNLKGQRLENKLKQIFDEK
ncbi:MAG: TlpA family protein disulfide reductase [Flavobacteriales bacterium]